MTDPELPIYLDYNATTPHDPEVIAAMWPYLQEHFGNPSSSHEFGRETKQAVQIARSQVASLLNCQPDEIVFTGGGTESNNYAVQGIAFAQRHQGNHIITTQIEHPAVLEVCRFLESVGFEITYLPVDEYGGVKVEDVEKAIRSETILVTIMHANNEVGTIQPLEEVAALARARNICIHTDAAQSVGKIPADVKTLGVDALSVAGHKLYAPKGVGALYVRQGVKMRKFMHGASHESGRRAGTENVMGIVGLGKACEVARRDAAQNHIRMKATRDLLWDGLNERLKGLRLNGHPEKRLPNTLSVSFEELDASALLESIQESVAASAGAACHSGGIAISHVLRAMRVPDRWAKGTLRFSTGRMTTEAEIDNAIEVIAQAVQLCQSARKMD